MLPLVVVQTRNIGRMAVVGPKVKVDLASRLLLSHLSSTSHWCEGTDEEGAADGQGRAGSILRFVWLYVAILG